jgi:iron complex outermembrane receptor protein
MSRHSLLRGVSAGALAVVTFAELAAPAHAQQNLPTIDVGGQRRAAAQRGPARAAGPVVAQPAAAAPTVVPVAAPVATPSPIVSRWSPNLPDGSPAFVKRWQIPNTVASVTQKYIEKKINIVDTQDALKYVPGLWVRKLRGGNEGLVQTRNFGLSAARNLVYADELLLSQLINNGHPDSQPRWGLISPEEIERIDYLYGPYSAQYPGNSMGGVIQITTRMPEKLEITAKQTTAVQDYNWWGVKQPFVTTVESVTAGDKIGDFSFFISANYQNNPQQPLTFINAGNGTNIFYPSALWSLGGYGGQQILVASGALATDSFINGKVKLAYDVTDDIRATYSLGVYNNDRTAQPLNYLAGGYSDAWGVQRPNAQNNPPLNLSNPTLQSIGQAYNRFQETVITNALDIKRISGGEFDWDISASHFTYPYSSSLQPWSALPVSFTPANRLFNNPGLGGYVNPFGGVTPYGRDTKFTGTYWTLFDAKGIYRPAWAPSHEASFGVHGDQFHSNNPVYFTSDWASGSASNPGGLIQSQAKGTTRTYAIWAQDAFTVIPDVKMTLGLRAETWKASDGYNQSFGTSNPFAPFNATNPNPSARSLQPIFQPTLNASRLSPKGSLKWTPDDKWTISANVGLANRFPTVRELYNLSVTPGATNQVFNPNPNLRPEVDLSKELNIERKLGEDGSARLTFFDDEVRDYILSNFTLAPGTNVQVSTNTNVDRVRNSGIEFAASKDNLYIRGLSVFGSVDFVNSRILEWNGWQPQNPTATQPFGPTLQWPWAQSVVGKNVPLMPKWRWTAGVTYSPNDHWSFTSAIRWQDRVWSTAANNDLVHGIFGSFDRFVVVDVKAHYKYNDRWSFDFGVDNVNNYKYAYFHPVPQRTFVFSGKYEYGKGKGEPGIFFSGNEAYLPRADEWFAPVAVNWD